MISSACSPVSGWLTSKRVGVDAELGGVVGIERVLRIDEGGDATSPLGVGHRVQRDRRVVHGQPVGHEAVSARND